MFDWYVCIFMNLHLLKIIQTGWRNAVIVYQGFGDTNIGQRFVLQEFYSFDRKFKVQIPEKI